MLSTKTRERGVTINLRASQRERALIDLAAESTGKNRSLFMLEAACGKADAVLADRRFFLLDEKEYSRFTAALDKKPVLNPRLKRLLASSPPWEK